MKRLGLLAVLLANSSVHALNIVQGWYGGILLGLNYTPNTSYTFPTPFTVPAQIPITLPTDVGVSLDYGYLGQIAGQVGYRCGKYRLEGQLGFNNSPYHSLAFNNVIFFDPSKSPYYSFQGATNTGYGMINGYYDFIPFDSESNFVPFVGLGLGYAYTQNSIDMSLWYDKNSAGATVPGYEVLALNINRSTSSAAGQVILGASYFLDDLTAFSLDARYFTTQKQSEVTQARVEVITLNLSFTGAFNFG